MRCDIFVTQSSKLNYICKVFAFYYVPVSVWFVAYCTYWWGAGVGGWAEVPIGNLPISNTLMSAFSLFNF